ncbi:MAG: hypothetical protein K8E66_10745, partial [Phycisphaerales bacterium]|nr:hypothetical protein [Phycisphaerales bacterium]
EWNGFRWTENEEGDGSADRAAEVATRGAWIGELARYTKALDPKRLVINPVIGENRGGGVARSLFYSRDFDVLMPHFYTLANEEPINNPSSDRAFQAAVEQARTTAMWMNMTHDRKPILNGEWGPARESWVLGTTYYTDQTYREGTYPDTYGEFTLAEDEDLYSAVVWAGLASGQFGTGLRMGADLLNFITGVNENNNTLIQGFILSDNMRATQELIALWGSTSSIGFDFRAYSPDSLIGRLRASSASGHTLHAYGAADASQGVVYVLQDRDARAGTVTDGLVSVAGLSADTLYDIEIWHTDVGTTGPASVIRGVFSTDGSLEIALPEFEQGVILRFRAAQADVQPEQVAAIRAGGMTISFTRGNDGQPVAIIFNSATDQTTTADISSLTNFRGRAVDMTPYRTPDGLAHLAVTDERRHLWVFHGDLATGDWTARDLT